jgi:hypothetical protein
MSAEIKKEVACVETFLFPKRVHRISFLARFLACLIVTQLLYAYIALSRGSVTIANAALAKLWFTDARSRRQYDSTQLLGERDGYRYIGLSRTGGDGAILA